MDNGLFPYTKRYLGTLRNHFSTLGVNGVNEMIRNFTADAHDITALRATRFALRLLDHVRARMVEFQEQTGHLYNLEATPAEGTTYRFAKEDRKRCPGILQAGTDGQPVLHELLPAAGRVHGRPVRGTRAAGRAADQVHGRHGAAPVHVRAAVDGRGVPRAGAALPDAVPAALPDGYADVLHLPGARLPGGRAHVLSDVRAVGCEVWTRVMGYHRPVASFNIGKKGEHAERTHFRERAAAPVT